MTLTIANPTIEDLSTAKSFGRPLRRIEASWVARDDGDSQQLAVLTVGHMPSNKAYYATLRREKASAGPFGTSREFLMFGGLDKRIGLERTARFSVKGLREFFDRMLEETTLQLMAGDVLVEKIFAEEGEA
jgi:hypothetical protein